MDKRFLYQLGRTCGSLLLTSVLLSACIDQPPHREQGTHAWLRSWFEVVSVNGQAPEDGYQLMLLPGQHELTALLETYRVNYLCHFQFEAVAGATYEIVDHSNPKPLVLYRWERANGAWAERLDPIEPSCEARPR